MSFTNTFLVEIDGTALPADIAPLLIAAPRRRQPAVPRPLRAALPRPRAPGARRRPGAKVGSAVKISVSTGDSQAPAAADDRRGHRAPGRVRRRRHVHRAPRVRRGAPAVPRSAYRGLHADDRLRHRPEGGPARRARRPARSPARRPSTSTCPRPAPATGTSCSGWPPTSASRSPSARGSSASARPTAASGAPAAGGAENTNPLVLQARRRPAAVPRRRHLGRAGQGGRGPRLGHRHQAGADRDQAGRRPPRSCCPTSTPPSSPTTFGDARYVVDRRPAPHPGRGGRRGRGAGRGGRRRRSPSSRGSRAGNPEVRAGAAVTMDGLGSPFDGKYTVTTSRHRLDPTTGYTTSFSVTGVRDRTHARPRERRRPGHDRAPGRRGRRRRRRQRPGEDRPRAAALPVARRHLRERLGAHRAGRRRQGPRRAGPARGRRRGAGRLRAGRLPAPVRPRRPLQRRRPAQPARASRPSTAARARSTGARSSPAAATGSTSSTRTARPRASPSRAATARSA